METFSDTSWVAGYGDYARRLEFIGVDVSQRLYRFEYCSSISALHISGDWWFGSPRWL